MGSHPGDCDCFSCAADRVQHTVDVPRLDLRINGVGRDANYPKSLIVYLNRPATDDEMRDIHYHLMEMNER